MQIAGVSYVCAFCGFGKYWIVVFFMVSGFVTSHSRTGKIPMNALPFLLQKVAPIYPLYLLGVLLATVVVYANGGSLHDWQGWRDLATSTVMVQTWYEPFHAAAINGPAWFMSCLVWYWYRFTHWKQAVACMKPSEQGCLLAFVWVASFTPHLICYSLFDVPLYRQWYGKYFHNFLEFSPLNNWSPFMTGLLIAHLVPVTQEQEGPAPEAAHADTEHQDGSGGSDVSRWSQWYLCLQYRGVNLGLGTLFAFFAIGDPPNFEMGTYELLIGKGPLLMPVVGLIFLGCSVSVPSDTYGMRLLVGLAPFGAFAWPLYILHVPLAALVPPTSTVDSSPFRQLWLKPIMLLAIVAVVHHGFDLPLQRRIRAWVKGEGPNQAEDGDGLADGEEADNEHCNNGIASGAGEPVQAATEAGEVAIGLEVQAAHAAPPGAR